MSVWFDEQTAGMVGGLLGTLVGVIYGGLGGGVGGFLVARGRGRRFVDLLFGSGVVLGLLSLATCGVALVDGQPWHVWYGFAIIGLVMTFVMGSLWPMMRWQLRVKERQRLDAAQLRDA